MSKESRNVPQRINEMEDILDQAIRKMDALEEKMAEYESFQPEIRKLEAYYTSPQWKEDFAADEAGEYPENLKRGVLSEDGIWNVLERNKELRERIGGELTDSEDAVMVPAEVPAEYAEVIGMFHRMWDGFPGLARLIDRNHHVIAANPVALEKGFAPGCVCAKVGAPEIHRQCKLTRLFQTGEAQTDNVIEDRIRGWMPVEGYPDLSVHFAVMIPEE